MDMSSPAASRGFSQASAKAMNPRYAVTVTDCLKRPREPQFMTSLRPVARPGACSFQSRSRNGHCSPRKYMVRAASEGVNNDAG
jgi:hypothetical protein